MNPDQQTIAKPLRFCGEPVSSEQLALITQIVTHCGGLSRTELANTVCELLDWVRPNGKAIAGKEDTGLRRIFAWLQGATAGA